MIKGPIPQLAALKVGVVDVCLKLFHVVEKLGVKGFLLNIESCAGVERVYGESMSQLFLPFLMWVFSQSFSI